MKNNLIYITEGITFRDIKNNKVSKIEVYEKQMNNWFIKPAELLAEKSQNSNNYEFELSLLVLLITFFESHGQYLKGESSQKNSKDVFNYGFKSFLTYLINIKNHKKEYYYHTVIDEFYALVRCGLLHNGYIRTNKTSFFIDRINMDRVHVLYPNNIISESWLINVNNMLREIKEYLRYYKELIQSDNESRKRFEKMFDMFFCID